MCRNSEDKQVYMSEWHPVHFLFFLSPLFSSAVFTVTSQSIKVIYHSRILQSVNLHSGTRQATHRQTGRGLSKKECEFEQERQTTKI